MDTPESSRSNSPVPSDSARHSTNGSDEEPSVITDSLSMHTAKRLKVEARKLDGMQRELYSLIGENQPPVTISPANKFKSRPEWQQKAAPWALAEFEPKEGLHLKHWVRAAALADGTSGDRFARFNTEPQIPQWTDEDYQFFPRTGIETSHKPEAKTSESKEGDLKAEANTEDKPSEAGKKTTGKDGKRSDSEESNDSNSKTDETKTIEQNDETKTVQQSDATKKVHPDENNSGENSNDENNNDETKDGETKDGGTKDDETKDDEIKDDETKDDEAKDDEAKKDEAKSDEAANDETKNEETAQTDSKSDTKPEDSQPAFIEWTLEETRYLFDLARDFDIRWPVIIDRYDYPGTNRSVDDLKERYYDVCRCLVQNRPVVKELGLSPHDEEYLAAINFSKANEIKRKAHLERLLSRNPKEVAEEEALILEARRLESMSGRVFAERRDLMKILESPMSLSNRTKPEINTSQGVAQLLQELQSEKSRKSNGSAAAASGSAGTAAAIVSNVLSRKLSQKELLAYGISYTEAARVKHSGVFLRSAKIAPVRQNILPKVKTVLTELGLPLKPIMPTSKLCTAYESMYQAIAVLLDAKKVQDKLEMEIEVLTKAKGGATAEPLDAAQEDVVMEDAS